jgi:transcriptional regulator with XRE-family HTH domain
MPRSSNVVAGLPPKACAQLVRLGASLAAIRKERGLSQENLAQRMFVSRQTLHRLEAGDPSVSLAVLAAAMFALGLSRRLDHLLEPQPGFGPGRQSQALGRAGDLDF